MVPLFLFLKLSVLKKEEEKKKYIYLLAFSLKHFKELLNNTARELDTIKYCL